MSEAFVLGVGARSALGLEARQLVMAARAGWLVPRRWDLGELAPRAEAADGEPAAEEPAGRGTGADRGVGVAFSSALPDSLQGYERALALAMPALEEALGDARAAGLSGDLLDAPLPLSLALPEPREPDDASFGRPMLEALGAVLPGGLDGKRSDLVRGGHAGFASVVQRALARVTESRGPAVVVVGGVDTYGQTSLLADLVRRRRVLSSRAVDGFVPGEAAAFAVVANAAALSHAGSRATPSAKITAGAVASQPDEEREDFVAGSAWTGLVADLAPRAGGSFGWVLTDLNPERHRHKEWTMVAIRQRSAIPADATLVRLGEEMGDLGAASGPMALAYATVGFRTRFAPSPRALVLLASERGERGAFVVEVQGRS